MSSNLPVDAARISEDIDALAAITEPGRPWTRRVFSPLFLEGRAYLKRRMEDAGLETRIDSAGNLIGKRKGTDGRSGVIMLGSHSDTVPDGGRFDGIAGVVAALEVARALKDRGVTLSHDLEIVDFLAEEVSPFGVSCIGSRGMTGQLPGDWLDRVNDGQVLRAALDSVGGDAARVMDEKRRDVSALLELHIEQGPVLENEKLAVGLVTAISGVTRFEVIIEGRADHAGTTPMAGRADALVAASRLVLDIREVGLQLSATPGHFAATVGEFRMLPNAANVVPAHVRLLIDARAEHRRDMETFATWLGDAVQKLNDGSGVMANPPVRVSDNPPFPCDVGLLKVLEGAAQKIGASHRFMASGAGHDAAWIARVAPAAMVFVPSRGGRSHCADEFTETAEIALGTAVLYEAVIDIDNRLLEQEIADGTHTG